MVYQEDIRQAIRAEENSGAAVAASLPKILAYIAFKPGVQAVGIYRLARWCLDRGLRVPAYALATISSYVTGADVPPTADLGPGLVILHPSGVVVSGGVRAGARLRLHSGAVLGFQVASTNDKGVPTLGDDVLVGVGAKILGPVNVGDGVKVGANAVVLTDVEAGRSAVGIPAEAL
jgi:serine O-acetyltransferase